MQVEDRLEIIDRLARYSALADQNDMDGYLELFTDDGMLELHVPWSDKPTVQVQGREQLRAAMQTVLEKRQGIDLKVMSTLPLFDAMTDTTARTRTPFFAFWTHTQHHPPMLKLSGWYIDDWQKIDGAWRIRRRSEQPSSKP